MTKPKRKTPLRGSWGQDLTPTIAQSELGGYTHPTWRNWEVFVVLPSGRTSSTETRSVKLKQHSHPSASKRDWSGPIRYGAPPSITKSKSSQSAFILSNRTMLSHRDTISMREGGVANVNNSQRNFRPSGVKSTTPSSNCSGVARCWVRFGIIKTPFDPQGRLQS